MDPAPKITAANARLRPRATPKAPAIAHSKRQPDGDETEDREQLRTDVHLRGVSSP